MRNTALSRSLHQTSYFQEDALQNELNSPGIPSSKIEHHQNQQDKHLIFANISLAPFKLLFSCHNSWPNLLLLLQSEISLTTMHPSITIKLYSSASQSQHIYYSTTGPLSFIPAKQQHRAKDHLTSNFMEENSLKNYRGVNQQINFWRRIREEYR